MGQNNDYDYSTNKDKCSHLERLGEMDKTRTCPTLELRIAGLALPLSENGPTNRR